VKNFNENINLTLEDKTMIIHDNGSHDMQDMSQQSFGVSRLDHRISQHVAGKEETNGNVERRRREKKHNTPRLTVRSDG
jgi:hypothetical protein